MSHDLDPSPGEISRLDALIRAARGQDGSARVDAETLLAYVRGTATNDERERVLAVLAASPELREELLHLMEVLEPGATDAFDAAEVPPAPPRPGRAAPPRPVVPVPSSRRRRILAWGAATGLAAAAVVAVLILGPGSFTRVSWERGPVLMMDQFEGGPLRGGAPEALQPRSLDEAATLAWLRAVSWTDGELGFRQPTQVPTSWARPLRIRFLDAGGAVAAELEILVPEGARELQLSLMSLDNLDTRRAAMPADRVAVGLPEDTGRFLVTVAFRSEEGLDAAPARLLETASPPSSR